MERTDRLSGTGWCFHYNAFPPGTDSFLLSAFPRLCAGGRVCDLGCGAGLLSLLLLRREPSLRITGVELDEEAFRLAERNVRENGLTDRLRILRGDLRNTGELPSAGAFDLVICNPPYFAAGSGAPADGIRRQTARFEQTCTLDEVCAAAARLTRWGGSFCLVYRPERLCDLLCSLREHGLEPKRLRFVQQRPDAVPTLVLAEGRRGGRPGLCVEAPLILQKPDGSPSPEADAVYH